MKLLIASDIHGSAYYCKQLIERIGIEQPHKIILLGDLLYHGPRNALPKDYEPQTVVELLNGIKDSVIAVRGNCESEVDQMLLEFPCMADYSTILLDEARSAFVTHGHLWNIDNPPPLPDGSLFFYGHTHIKQAEWIHEILYVNPGSVSIPKDGCPSYCLYEDKRISFCALDGTVLNTFDI